MPRPRQRPTQAQRGLCVRDPMHRLCSSLRVVQSMAQTQTTEWSLIKQQQLGFAIEGLPTERSFALLSES
eukprot:4882359-Amphidinium_carterae.1